MLQLQASKLVKRKNKAKQDKNSNIPQQAPNLNMSNIKEENICLKVEIILRLIPARAFGFYSTLMLNDDYTMYCRL